MFFRALEELLRNIFVSNRLSIFNELFIHIDWFILFNLFIFHFSFFHIMLFLCIDKFRVFSVTNGTYFSQICGFLDNYVDAKLIITIKFQDSPKINPMAMAIKDSIWILKLVYRT